MERRDNLSLSEILEDYKEADELHKIEIIEYFTELLWDSKYTYKTYKSYYKYNVSEELLGNRQDLIDLFSKYKVTEFVFCKSYYKQTLNSIDYIRIHLNNMYGYLVDNNVYLSKDYYQLLLSPKAEYYNAIERIKNGEVVNIDEIAERIKESLTKAEYIKEKSIEKKIKMKWSEYKSLVNTYIERIFNNFIPLHEYEQMHGWEMKVDIDGWNEDNYIIKYFNRSMTGYLRNYRKSLQPKLCKRCKLEISKGKNNMYCETCKKSLNKINKQIWEGKLVLCENIIYNSINKYGSKMKIIEWKNKHNISVTFDNGYTKKKVKYNDFLKGNVSYPYDKRIYGVGFFGEGKYKSSVNGKKTKQYITWFSMMNRCYSEKYTDREKTYKDVKVCEEWHNFQNFAEWFDKNYYEIQGETMTLDKDVLNNSNKTYSPSSCIFLPKSINNLFISGKSRRGDLPIGVKYYEREKRYYVYCGDGSNGKRYGGSFQDLESAFSGYKELKETIIMEKALEYRDRMPELVFNALVNYKVNSDD